MYLATAYSKQYTNNDYVLNVLQKPRLINNNLSQFWAQNEIPPPPPSPKKKILCQTALQAKVPPGGSYLFVIYDVFRQNADLLGNGVYHL